MKNIRFATELLVASLLCACDKTPSYVTPVPPPAPVIVTPFGSDYDFSVVEKPLEASMILTSGNTLRYQSVMQSFALMGDGSMYGVQVGTSTNKYLLNVTRKGVDSDSGKSYMQLPFAGHGGNMDVERSGGVDYIWIGSYGSWTGEKYTNSQTCARIPFRAGGKFLPADCPDQYWVPGLRNVSPALDIASDLLLIWGLANGESNTGYFKVYKLSEAMALPLSEVKLERAVNYGGQDSGYPEVSETPAIKARNLGRLSPVANIRLNGGVIGTGAHQGFAIHGNLILHLSGGGNDANPSRPSSATLTIMDLSGKTLGRHNIGAVSSIPDLNSFGITDTGFMEAEGVKLYDDVLYLGFATKHGADTKRMVTIFQYKLNQ